MSVLLECNFIGLVNSFVILIGTKLRLTRLLWLVKLWVRLGSFKDLGEIGMQIVTKGTRTVFRLVALTNEPQSQLCVPTMLRSKLLDQVCQLLPTGGLALQTRDVPLPLWPPGNIELSH